MLKLTRTYKSFNDEEFTEDFYFNLTEAECMELELGKTGGLAQQINKIVAAQDAPQIISIFKTILLKSYGEKSPDGKRFIKSKEISDAFAQTQVYSDLFMELATDDKKLSDFINAILPAPRETNNNVVPIN